MNAVIFAAGIGSRLRPFTDEHPKAVAPVHGEPAVVGVARKLATAGASRIIVNIHHFPEQVVDAIEGAHIGVPVDFSDESALLLDTGGALVKIAREHPELCTGSEPIVVHNADVYTDFPIAEMLTRHAAAAADVTLLVDSHRSSSRSFLFDGEGRLRAWLNSTTGAVLPEACDINGLTAAPFGGVHVLSPAFLTELGEEKPDVPFSITPRYIDLCCTHRIMAYTPSEPYRWHDIGTPEKLAAANAD
ncbi:MAG: sugar phosphate nucleotidyltransferase [Muribaculaceae bacterium]|nr:sugar phosphate nucleotidyltransferase [Muribaculaceae bacterium]